MEKQETFIYHKKIQIMIKQESYTMADESGEEAQKRTHGAYRHWAPSEWKLKIELSLIIWVFIQKQFTPLSVLSVCTGTI